MARLTSLITLFIFAFISTPLQAQEANQIHKDSLIAIVEQYYKLNLKVYQAYSTAADIDNLFNLFTKDFTFKRSTLPYVFTKKDHYEGYSINQKNGSYNSRVIEFIIVNKIVGTNALVTEKRVLRKAVEGTKEGELEMTLFEFRKGKIFRITEYW